MLGFTHFDHQILRQRPVQIADEMMSKTTKGNETSCVAFLSQNAPVTLGQMIKQHRLKLRKTRKQLASELGVSVKTLWGWKTNRWQPSASLRNRVRCIALCAGLSRNAQFFNEHGEWFFGSAVCAMTSGYAQRLRCGRQRFQADALRDEAGGASCDDGYTQP